MTGCGNCGCAPCMCGAPGFVTYRGYTRSQAKHSVGKGWRPLLDPIFDWLDAHSDAGALVTQVKEKYGTLRIYVGTVHDELANIVDVAEEASGETCEMCGAPGSRTTDRRWILTLCDACKVLQGRT